MTAEELFRTKAETIKECLDLLSLKTEQICDYKQSLIEDDCNTIEEDIKLEFGKKISEILSRQFRMYQNCIKILEKKIGPKTIK